MKSLFEGYEFCEQRGMGAYGGGQYELGVGRGHVQLLAALFHPERARTTSRRAATTRSIPSPGCPRARSTSTRRRAGSGAT